MKTMTMHVDKDDALICDSQYRHEPPVHQTSANLADVRGAWPAQLLERSRK